MPKTLIQRPSQTALERIMNGRTQPPTPVEYAFFSVPDVLVKPVLEDRVPINIDPAVRERLRRVLLHDDRFNGAKGNGMGFSEFITRALDALGCED